MKLTRLRASKDNTIYYCRFGKEARVGAFIRTGTLSEINSVYNQ